MKNRLIAIFLALLLFGLCACETKPETPEDITALREWLSTSSEPFAYAYLGIYQEEDLPLTEQIQTLFPYFADTYTLPDAAHTVGTHGELYFLVPQDPHATVSVNRIHVQENGTRQPDEVCYRSEYGEPIFVFCNTDTWIPDTVITVTDQSGQKTEWYPCLDSYGYLIAPSASDGTVLTFDLTPYWEMGADITADYLAAGWRPLYSAEAFVQNWVSFDYGNEEPMTRYLDILADGTFAYTCTAGILTEAEWVYGTWSWQPDGSYDWFHLSWQGETAAEEHVAVLIAPDGQSLIMYRQNPDAGFPAWQNETEILWNLPMG